MRKECPPTCADEQTDGSSSVISEDPNPGPRDPAASSDEDGAGDGWCLPLALTRRIVLCSWDAVGWDPPCHSCLCSEEVARA